MQLIYTAKSDIRFLGLYVFFLLTIFCFLPYVASAAVLQKPANNLGLVGYWNFNEGSGTIATDYSVSKNVGTLTGSPLWVEGKFGKAVQFNSFGSVQITSAPAVNANGSFTYSIWIYPKSYTNGLASDGAGTYFLDRQGITSPLTSIKAVGDKFCYQTRYDDNSGLGCTSSTTNIPLNAWTHIVVVRDYNSNFYLYFNGVQQGATADAGSLALTPDAPKLGSHQDGGGNVDGRIDDFRIYSRALSPSEVVALYKTKAAISNAPQNKRLTNGLVGMWSFNGLDMNWLQNKALDKSGGGNDGILNGMSTTTSPTLGKVGQALTFDGSSSVLAPPAANINDLTTMTVAGWFNQSSCASGFCTIVGKGFGITPSVSGWKLMSDVYGGGRKTLGFTADFSVTDLVVESSTVFSESAWNHVAVTWDGGITATNVHIYLNGVEVAYQAQVNGSGTYSSDAGESLGLGWVSSTNTFAGKLDEARVYNRALSAAEVKQLYLMGGANVNHNQNNRSSNGLVGFWSFNGLDINWLQNKALDRTVNGNDGVITNMPTTTAPTMGKVGQAFDFDGTDDYIEVPDQSYYEINNSSLTVSAWVKADSYPANNTRMWILSKGGGSGWEWELSLLTSNFTDDHSIQGAVYDNVNTGYLVAETVGSGATEIAIGEWYHVTMVYNHVGPSLTLYVNGVSGGIDTTTAGTIHTPSTNTVRMGLRQDGSGESWDGALDEARIYNRALSAAEVKQLHLMGK